MYITSHIFIVNSFGQLNGLERISAFTLQKKRKGSEDLWSKNILI